MYQTFRIEWDNQYQNEMYLPIKKTTIAKNNITTAKDKSHSYKPHLCILYQGTLRITTLCASTVSAMTDSPLYCHPPLM